MFPLRTHVNSGSKIQNPGQWDLLTNSALEETITKKPQTSKPKKNRINSLSSVKEETVEAAGYCHRWCIYCLLLCFLSPTGPQQVENMKNIAKQGTNNKILHNMMCNTYTEVNCLHLTAFWTEWEQTHLENRKGKPNQLEKYLPLLIACRGTEAADQPDLQRGAQGPVLRLIICL